MPTVLNKKRKLGGKGTLLSDKQRVFADEYLANGMNVAKAAEVAGYKHPGVVGFRVLKMGPVKKYLQSKGTQLIEKKELRSEDVIEQLTRILRFNIMKAFKRGGEGQYLEVTAEKYDAIAEAIGDCVNEVQTKTRYDEEGEVKETVFLLKLMSKEKALEILAKYFGILSDKTEVQQTINLNWNDMFVPDENRVDPIEQKILEVSAEPID